MAEKKIPEEYRGMYETAVEISNLSLKEFPLEEKETFRDRVQLHLVAMLEMYNIKYGDHSPIIFTDEEIIT